MTYEFEYLLYLLGCAVQNTKAIAPQEAVDWGKLFQLAKEQTVYPMVLYVLKQQPELYGVDHKEWVKRELRILLVSEVSRRDESAKLLRVLEEAGVTPVVLKGYSLSVLYPEPTVRQSADLDIYVGLENENKAQEVLRAYGVNVKERAAEAQEASCYFEPVGCIELHAWLMGKDDRTAWLANNPSGITQPFKIVTLENGDCVRTLGDDDNMLFLALHFIKHFVKYGANLRNMLDVILFYRYYSKNCDCAAFWSKMKALRFGDLIRAIITAGIRFCSLPKDDFACAEMTETTITERVAADIEDGGWMGQKESEDRNRIRLIYEKALYDRTASSGKVGFLWRQRARIIKMIGTFFCSRQHLYSKYPYSRKSVIFLPLAYLHRGIDSTIKMKKGQVRTFVLDTESEKQRSKITQRRSKLLEDLGIL